MRDEIKNSSLKAYRWAKNRLMRLEGTGHEIHIHKETDESNPDPGSPRITCSFAKPSWSGDHCGRRQATGALAIITAVLEYEYGF
jgi:hypothetical protein